MPLVTSHADLLADVDCFRQPARTADTIHSSTVDQVHQVCEQVLEQESELVARVAVGQAKREYLVTKVRAITEKASFGQFADFEALQQKVLDFLFGYGPLQRYIEDEQVSDIDGTGPAEFTIKISGQRRVLPVAFSDIRTYDTFCRLMIIRNGGVINDNDSHCRVADERYRLRINVTVPPRSVGGPTICIRKHRQDGLRLEQLAALHMMNARSLALMKELAASDKTVLFCGKGGAGKTTLLRAFLSALPLFERVLVAESDCELYPEKPYCLVQKIKKPGVGGKPVSLRDLISDGLTMSLDTYCIGEITGSESMDFIRAAFSGHRCLATTHANSAADGLDRLLSLARPAAHGEQDDLLRKMLAAGIDVVVYLESFKVCQIIFIEGIDAHGGGYVYSEILGSCEDETADPTADKSAVALVRGS